MCTIYVFLGGCSPRRDYWEAAMVQQAIDGRPVLHQPRKGDVWAQTIRAPQGPQATWEAPRPTGKNNFPN